MRVQARTTFVVLRSRFSEELSSRHREVDDAALRVNVYVEEVMKVNAGREADLKNAVEALTQLHAQVRMARLL